MINLDADELNILMNLQDDVNHRLHDRHSRHANFYEADEKDGDRTYQWLPTEFMLKFKTGFINDGYNVSLHYDEFMDIELVSGFIPDINCRKYADLMDHIVMILRQKIIPLFAKNQFGKKKYIKKLFEWCSNNKILAIIVKSQQYEWSEEVSYEDKYNPSFHVEGTEMEKITQIGIVYTRIDDGILGGDLRIHPLRDGWVRPFKKKTEITINNLCDGDIVVFKNTEHAMSPLGFKYKSNDNPPIRRILAFFLCENQPEINGYYESTMYKYFVRDDERVIGGDKLFWKGVQDMSKQPLMTATVRLPILRDNYYDYIQPRIVEWVRNGFDIELPDIITFIIAEFTEDVRNDYDSWMIAQRLRLSRGHQKRKRHEGQSALIRCD